MALTNEQFKALYDQGLSPDQIANFEQGNTPDTMSTVREHARIKSKSLRERAPEIGQGVGGLVGGLAGGTLGLGGGPAAPVTSALGGIGGAGVGGEVGRGVGNLIAGQPFGEGVGEAGMTEMAFQSLGPLARLGGKQAMRLALNVTPQVAQTAIREGIMATRGFSKGGWEILKRRIKEVGQTEMRIARVAQGKGIGWADPIEFIRPVYKKVADKVVGGGESALAEVSALRDKFLKKDFPYARLSPIQLLKIRKYSDVESSAMKKFGAKATTQAEKLWQDALSNRAREVLRNEIPAIADPQAYLKLTGKATTPHDLQLVKDALMPLVKSRDPFVERAARAAAAHGGRAAIGAGVGAALPGDRATHAWEGAILGSALLHPASLSGLALLANNPLLGQLLIQGPRAVQAMSE